MKALVVSSMGHKMVIHEVTMHHKPTIFDGSFLRTSIGLVDQGFVFTEEARPWLEKLRTQFQAVEHTRNEIWADFHAAWRSPHNRVKVYKEGD
ncbi:hypothetical protein CMI37_30315 [Candidatus Pacearchaeota archaeon]|nr:hypothetical protein [Candidatus Pacearchaeota archaeon]